MVDDTSYTSYTIIVIALALPRQTDFPWINCISWVAQRVCFVNIRYRVDGEGARGGGY